MNKSDVIIVGGGVIGSAAAYYLAKRGVRALVLEKDEMANGGSSRNGGGVRQSARDDRELPLAMHAVRNLWPNLSEELGINIEYHQPGNLRLGKTEQHARILEQIVSQGHKHGLDIKIIRGDEIRKICPYVSEEVNVASFCPGDGHANPMRTSLGLYKRSRELGVEFTTGVTATSILIRKGKVAGVVTSAGIYQSDQVIIAAGIDSRSIAGSVGIDIPMQRILLEALVTDAQPPMFPQMFGTAASDFYGHQTDHGSFVFGGMTGLEPYGSYETTPVTRAITAPSICRAILKYFPVLGRANIIRTWAGFVDKTSDGVPVISAVDGVPGLVLAYGFSAHGFGISPAVGQLISEMVIDGKPSVSLEAFRYDRFKPRT